MLCALTSFLDWSETMFKNQTLATQGLVTLYLVWKNVSCAEIKITLEGCWLHPQACYCGCKSAIVLCLWSQSGHGQAAALLSLYSSWRPAALYGELENGKAANHAWCNLHLIDEGLRITETINLYQDSCGPKSRRLCHWYPILIFALINHLPFHIYFVFRINFCRHRC